ncbi:DeoR family transcriptional regulator [Undibacter mobilis]|uniref:DeoR family transcriptional regulator n=1 Tax=Undibacter mobilis TaxID=2292256 RepID=A0A371B9F5_9BRAD|nr:DeoR family transcriptional regulator [Undibacter mobilis]RDV04011.1 DeoR family transcriptional regulator [Undibacter mobilis]
MLRKNDFWASTLKQRDVPQTVRSAAYPPPDIEGISRNVAELTEFFRRLCAIKSAHSCDFVDVMIVLACCLINASYVRPGSITLQPANINSVASYLGISRETVRRRLQNLEYKGLVARYPSGYVATEDMKFLKFVDALRLSQA